LRPAHASYCAKDVYQLVDAAGVIYTADQEANSLNIAGLFRVRASTFNALLSVAPR
jgi:hypothetical protein